MDAKRYVGVLVKCNDKILLCKRNNQGSFPGMWSIPAGKLEDNESTKQGAKREFFEETAINIDDVPLKFIGLVPRHTRDGKKIKGLMYVYLLETNEELHPDFEKATDGEEHTDYGYFVKEQLEQNKIGTYLFRLLEIILEKD
jgi:8-oxo-dGTP pyrophosphatase MutT (NUDIX family)